MGQPNMCNGNILITSKTCVEYFLHFCTLATLNTVS